MVRRFFEFKKSHVGKVINIDINCDFSTKKLVTILIELNRLFNWLYLMAFLYSLLEKVKNGKLNNKQRTEYRAPAPGSDPNINQINVEIGHY